MCYIIVFEIQKRRIFCFNRSNKRRHIRAFKPEGAGVVFEAPYAEAGGEVFWAVSPVPPSVGWVLTAEEIASVEEHSSHRLRPSV